ncbi:hypothetical protein CSAL01_13129 [Colletotrichum salicis]|uniref:Uncharacterized protein n=1 Tax=Colletotrichum salicis TaxID=1209931 RepID=A0A135V672_9PEZI|nr:hypothetical protein CSAL01_13129 [Colletotrichum salicis]
MATTQQQYDEGPELAPQHQYPEVYHPPPQQSYSASPQPEPVTPMKQEGSTYGYPASGVDQSVYGGAPYHSAAGGETAPQKNRKTVCGCTFLVFLLSVIIAVLAAAVIGNKNAPNSPLMSLFTANFDNCMDACAAFTNYEPGFEGNATCAGVSFIPLWTTREGAVAGSAPGNCYLKPGNQTKSSLETPNIGTECHAAIMS